MFWDRFYKLCISNSSKPNPVAKDLGISSSVLTKWKNGISYPNGEILISIAKYFDCSIDYLVGLSDCPKSYNHEITSNDIEILKKLHSLPEDSKEEIIHMLEYKYNKLQEKRKATSSPSAPPQGDNRFA
ncbi:MAG: helix-turn-helix domain-containing protein [Lachnospiraceae bacterium]|nr:helix-turn-helix domain-containing protein [Lachnospiraceae bacterium]